MIDQEFKCKEITQDVEKYNTWKFLPFYSVESLQDVCNIDNKCPELKSKNK